MNIIERLLKDYGQLTKLQQKVADFIINNSVNTSFMTINQLSKMIGTSTTTIIRLANHLGYSRYSDFQAALQEIVISNPPSDTLEKWTGNRDTRDNVVFEIANMQLLNLQETLRGLSNDSIYEAVNLLLSANHIYMAGNRTSYSVTYFIYRHLSRLLGKCDIIPSNPADMADKIISMKEGDVLVAISMPRYLNNGTSVARYAKAKGAKVISITGGLNSPLREYSDVLIPVPAQSGSYFRTIIPAMMVAEIITGLVAYMSADVSMTRLPQIESLENDKKFFP